jgi:phosphoglycolate phosphatase-like HAD superfamily hydrolase/uridine kinase
MINPQDVGIIIFDMDGTIIASLPAVYESVKRAFKKLGWPVTFSPEEINVFFGVSVASTRGSLYEFITPKDSPISPDEVRELVRNEYHDAFYDFLEPYPGVKETLAELRRRGYKLAQYTNASTSYVNIVMGCLNLRESYDYVECIQDNGLNKEQLVRKIREHFGGLPAAVVGDRSHDIEAAHANGALAVGALYGYGDDEPKAADITINKFSDLLTIFDRKLPVFQAILDAANKQKDPDRPFVIGIGGIDGAGKSTFAARLEVWLKAQGRPTQLIHLDDFHNPKAVRYTGSNQPENYYERSFNLELLVEKLLKPIRTGKTLSATLTLLNLETDKFEVKKAYKVTQKTIIILEGVFLFRQELAPYIDFKVHLDITPEESKRRAVLRDKPEIVSRYDVKYLPAQLKYLKQYPPSRTADMIIDNAEPENPRLVYLRK